MLLTGGTFSEVWSEIVGYPIQEDLFYEYHLYKPSEECPYIEKSYVKILAPRDRKFKTCYFLWKPPVEKYDGPWFE